ncbi:Protein AGENET DOMAIN (AGD)-CONTAINING P1 [Linum perenne]
MNYRKGNLVEILSREIGTEGGSWFAGKVISALDDTNLLVRYDSILDDDREPLTETVSTNEVRPRPPVTKGDKNWKVGDVVEVFDVQCWRGGRIVKAFKNNSFIVKLSGSLQHKEFHESNIRLQLVWHKNKWFITGKDAQTRSKGTGGLVSRQTLQPIGRLGDECLTENQKFPGRGRNSLNNHRDRSIRGHKRPLDQKNADSTEEARPVWFDASGFVSRPLQNEDNSYQQCSVASCSSNEFPHSNVHEFRQSTNVVSENSDAESSFPSLSAKKQRHESGHNSEEVDIHALEFHAYMSTVKALYVSGPLSWEQELLLTNLRESLHISDEEHLLELRRLLSSEAL